MKVTCPHKKIVIYCLFYRELVCTVSEIKGGKGAVEILFLPPTLLLKEDKGENVKRKER